MANIAPPFVINGAASLAILTKEWQETSIALAKPSAEQLRRPPWRSALGAKAIEWTRMSSVPHAPALSCSRSPDAGPWRHRYQNLLCHKCDSHNSDYGTISIGYKRRDDQTRPGPFRQKRPKRVQRRKPGVPLHHRTAGVATTLRRRQIAIAPRPK